jgi:hypothetical protein
VESIKCFTYFRFSILIVIYNCILKYVDFLFDSIEHQKLDIFKELCQKLIVISPAWNALVNKVLHWFSLNVH